MSDEKSILYLNLIMWAKHLPHGTQSTCAPFPFLLLYSIGSREPLVVSKWGRNEQIDQEDMRSLRSEQWRPKQEG